jgi:hypothetical protein
MQEHQDPASWAKAIVQGLQWPFIVGAAFWLGRVVQRLEARLKKSESNLTALIERHMPAIHRALSEIKVRLEDLVGR